MPPTWLALASFSSAVWVVVMLLIPLTCSLMYLTSQPVIVLLFKPAMPPTVLPVLRAPAETRPSVSALPPIVPE